MQASIFNLRVPLSGRDDVFLMNTLTDAQLIVSRDVADLLDRAGEPAAARTPEEQEALAALADHGFLVEDRQSDRDALDQYFERVRHDTDQLQVTVLTTLQCNFACDYCFQGDHGNHDAVAGKMTLETAARVAAWTEAELDRLHPQSLLLTFFGGEPLLNLPVMYDLADRLAAATRVRGMRLAINVITNGLLLTPEIVDRLSPLGLNGIKITLDGDRETHNRMRPLRGGQGTFDRIIENIRRVAGKCQIAIGGNFDEDSFGSYPALLDFLAQQDFASRLVKVNFKPVIRTAPTPPSLAAGALPLMPVSPAGKPLNGTCMTTAGAGNMASPCDTCDFLDDKMAFLRHETRRRGLPTVDGVHMGPCQLHKQHAHTIGPDGSLYACPGFTGEQSLSTGHIDGRHEARRADARARFDRLGPWRECADCAFIPVCAGGCSVASHTQLGDMNAPTCHKRSFESALQALAEEAAAAALGVLQ